MRCCFFGHKDTPDSVAPVLGKTIECLIVNEEADSFMVGNNGRFDAMVYSTLKKLKEKYPHIDYHVVLAYMPGAKQEFPSFDYTETFLPEGIELVPPRFAISWRNKWMVHKSDTVICYVKHSWGGAAQFMSFALHQKRKVINLADEKKLFSCD